jgi:hypothetical protein
MEHQEELGESHRGQETNRKGDPPKLKKGKQGPRKRVSQACDRCRSRKDKCDGKKPACSTCVTNDRQCSYVANVKKRGLPEGYVRGLEKLWGLAIREVRGVEDNLSSVISSEDGNDTFLDTWNDESNSETLVETWRKSYISKELERILSLPESTETGKRKRAESDSTGEKKIGLDIDHTGLVDSFQSNTEKPLAVWSDRKYEQRPQDEYRASPSVPRYLQQEYLEGSSESILSPVSHPTVSSNGPAIAVDAPELPSETWHLLDVYFSYTHSWLPIIEKHDILRTSYQYSQSRNNVSVSGQGSGDHAVLWAAIAYAKFQHRAINNIPHAQGHVAEMVWTAERMYVQARKLIPTEEGVFELGHIQALLILALANLGNGYSSRAWLLVGQAVRIAIDLGLDKPKDDIFAPLRSKSRNKHVFLGCFAIDTIIAARLEHRPHLRTDDLDQVGSVEEDGLEEWDPWTDCLSVRRSITGNTRGPASLLSTFNKLIQVLTILNEAICISDSSKTVQLSTTLLEKLHIWSRDQTSPIYLDSAVMSGNQVACLLPHHYSLHLSYFNTLAKTQLLAHDEGKESVNLEPSTRSARQIVDLLKQHSNNFGPLIVPPTFEYFTKTAYDVVREVNDSIESTHIKLNDWKHNLDNCLEAMEPAWPAFESFKDSRLFQITRPTPRGRRESQVAFDLINSMNQAVETPAARKTPNTYGVTSAQFLKSSQALIGNMSRMSDIPQPPPSHRTSLSQPSFQGALNSFEQSPRPIFQPPSNDPWPAYNQSHPLQTPTLAQPRIQPPRSVRSDFELDPMFQEFATLDATEWYLPSPPTRPEP